MAGDVPESLKNKTLFSLDMGALVAGAKYRGEFEETMETYLISVTVSPGFTSAPTLNPACFSFSIRIGFVMGSWLFLKN